MSSVASMSSVVAPRIAALAWVNALAGQVCPPPSTTYRSTAAPPAQSP